MLQIVHFLFYGKQEYFWSNKKSSCDWFHTVYPWKPFQTKWTKTLLPVVRTMADLAALYLNFFITWLLKKKPPHLNTSCVCWATSTFIVPHITDCVDWLHLINGGFVGELGFMILQPWVVAEKHLCWPGIPSGLSGFQSERGVKGAHFEPSSKG